MLLALMSAQSAPQRPATAAKPDPVANSYTALPEAERIGIQDDLIWTGDYNGIADGTFNDRAIAAVKAFQRAHGGKETGVLNPPERATLATIAKRRRAATGWQAVVDPVTGARLGIPTKLVGNAARSDSGSRWTSSRGEIQIETFKLPPGGTLQAAYEAQRKEPAQRKPTYTALRNDFFVISGLQGLKKFYVRAQEKDGAVRGFTILYDQAMEGTVDPVVIAMSNMFAATTVAAGPPPKRKVEYGSAVVLDAAGHLATSREVTEECQTITVAGLGPAVVAAEEKDGGLAVLRVYGARGLKPIMLASAAGDGSLNLRGIADPQMQNGGNAVTTVSANVAGGTVAPTPASGFAGAAALDRDGKLAGVIDLRPQLVAGPATASRATLIPAGRIRALMIPFGGIAADAATSVSDVKGSVLRVICTRK
jgi:peptidoglycan hydrolase-like protein with peptidoglycan-binding domain